MQKKQLSKGSSVTASNFVYGGGYIFGSFERKDVVKIYDVDHLDQQSVVPVSEPQKLMFFDNTLYILGEEQETVV